MANLSELLAQRNALDQQIEKTQREERQKAIAQIKTLMSEYGLSVSDLSARVAKKGRSGTTIPGNSAAVMVFLSSAIMVEGTPRSQFSGMNPLQPLYP